MKTQTLKPIFGQKHREYISRAVRATISVAEGAVRAGKTVDNVAAFAYLIDRGTPDRIHLATGSTAANAKLNIGAWGWSISSGVAVAGQNTRAMRRLLFVPMDGSMW